MHIKIISEEKLKVTLSAIDLKDYGIRLEDIDYDNTETRRVFWTILDKAKIETGFDAASSRIFIQIYPNTDGGCEMYVSRIKSRRDDTVKLHPTPYSSEQTTEHIYRFSRLEHLTAACKALNNLGFSGISSAYMASEDGEESYLILVGETKWSLPLSEYGEKCDGQYEKWRILERYTLICEENAANILGKL